MPLFKMPTRNTMSDSDILNKSKSIKSSNPVMKGSGSLISRITSISNMVQTKLGKYKDEYDVIRNESKKLHNYISKCIENGICAIDTETTGLDPMLDDIVGFSIYTPGEKAIYIPINHISYITALKADNQISIDIVSKELQRLEDNKVRIIMFNAPFDIRVIWSHTGVRLHCFWDCYIATRLLNENEPSNALKALHVKYVEKTEDEAWTFGKLFDGIVFSYVPIKDAYIYAARDAKVTFELYEYQLPYLTLGTEECKQHKLEGPSNVFFNIEMPVMDSFIDMEQTGILLDKEYSSNLSKKYHEYVDKSKSAVTSILNDIKVDIDSYRRSHINCGLEDPVNPASNLQLSCIIYDVLKIPVVDEKNPRGVGKEILEQIDHPLCKAIVEQRKLEKLLSTYIDKMPEIAHPNDGRVHCKFNQVGTDCIVGNTLIPTPSGYFTMSELCEPANADITNHIDVDDIYVFNCDKQIEKVQSVIKYENYATIKITTEYGFTIEGTYNHPIMVSKIKKNDIVRNHSDKMYREFWNNRYFKTLDTIEIGDIVEVPCYFNCNPDYQLTGINDKNLEYFSEDLSLFLGMYHADGCTRSRYNKYEIRICNGSKDVYNSVKELSAKLFSMNVSYYEDSRDTINTATSYIVGDSLFVLDKFLFKGAVNKKMPRQIWKSPNSVINNYLKGMTLDSSVYRNTHNNPEMLLNVMDEADANFIRIYLISQGIITSIHKCLSKHKNYYYYRLKFSTNDYILFRDSIGFVESEKLIYDIDNKYLIKKHRIINGSLKATVKKIEYSHNDVYDLHLPITHSFISNGLISHNTGRTSSNSPNLQNIPSRAWKLIDGTKIDAGHDVRRMFRASPGNILISCDYSAQEPRLTAHLSKDEKMVKAYQEGKDVYSEIASIAFNKTYEECLEFVIDENGKKVLDENGEPITNADGKARRGQAKQIVLGINYGMSIPSIAEKLHCDKEKAQQIYDDVLNKFTGLKAFKEESEAFARKYGYVTTAWGRKRRLPDMQLPYFEFEYKEGALPDDFDPLGDDTDSSYTTEVPQSICDEYTKKLLNATWKQKQRIKDELDKKGIKVFENTRKIGDATRQVVNSRVQGSAADLTKLAMIRLYNNQELRDLGFKMLIPIHDEILAECPKENVRRCAELMNKMMVDAAEDLIVPIKCDQEITEQWYGESVKI